VSSAARKILFLLQRLPIILFCKGHVALAWALFLPYRTWSISPWIKRRSSGSIIVQGVVPSFVDQHVWCALPFVPAFFETSAKIACLGTRVRGALRPGSCSLYLRHNHPNTGHRRLLKGPIGHQLISSVR